MKNNTSNAERFQTKPEKLKLNHSINELSVERRRSEKLTARNKETACNFDIERPKLN